MNARMSQADLLKARTKTFAVKVVLFCRTLPRSLETYKIAGQLIEAATSVGANYRACCRARSPAEFISKIGVVLEEADESEILAGSSCRARSLSGESESPASRGRRIDGDICGLVDYGPLEQSKPSPTIIFNRPFPICDLRSAICNVRSAMCDLPSAICSCHLPAK